MITVPCNNAMIGSSHGNTDDTHHTQTYTAPVRREDYWSMAVNKWSNLSLTYTSMSEIMQNMMCATVNDEKFVGLSLVSLPINQFGEFIQNYKYVWAFN